MDWIFFSLIAVVSLGVSMALYKMPSFQGYSSLHSTLWTNIFTFIIAVVVFFIFTSGDGLFVISWYGLLWGMFFALTMAQQKILLKRMETNTLLPVTSSLGNILTIGLGIILFSEFISLLQYIAITLIILSVFLYGKKKGGLILDVNSISLGVGIIIASTVSKVIQKFGAIHDTIFHFSLYQYSGAIICALVLIFVFEKKSFSTLFVIERTWKISLLIAIFSAIGGYSLLKALSIGPLSGVYAVQPSYIIVTALLGMVLYKESLTRYKITLMVITIAGVILLKLG